MAKEKQTLSLDLKRTNETRNYLIEEMINDLMNKKHKNACRNLYYSSIFFFSFLLSVVVFQLVGVPVGITSSAVELKLFAITAGIKKYKSIIEKKGKKAW